MVRAADLVDDRVDLDGVDVLRAVLQRGRDVVARAGADDQHVLERPARRRRGSAGAAARTPARSLVDVDHLLVADVVGARSRRSPGCTESCSRATRSCTCSAVPLEAAPRSTSYTGGAHQRHHQRPADDLDRRAPLQKVQAQSRRRSRTRRSGVVRSTTRSAERGDAGQAAGDVPV